MKCRKLSEPTEAAAQHGHMRSTTAPGQRQRSSTAQGPQQRGTSGQGGPGQPQQLLHSSGGCGDVSTTRHGHGQTQRNTGTKERPSLSQIHLLLPDAGMDGISHITFYSICAV